jgi:hypothetical protein
MTSSPEVRTSDTEDGSGSDALDRPRDRSVERPVKGKSASAPSGLGRLVSDLRSSAGDSPGQTLLATFVAWSTTVAPAALSRSASRPAALVAVLGLVAGLSGPLLRGARPTIARHVGITLFLALTTFAWLLGSPALAPARLDPLRAAVGAVAWGAFALSWRERWETKPSDAVSPRDPMVPLLQARSTLPRGAVVIAALGVVSGLGYLILAWQVRDGDRALAAQAVAVACAIAVSTIAASIAVDRGRRSSRSTRRMTPPAQRALLMLLVFGVAGVAVFVVRG